jgi:uncharacterized protein (DUF983 family)
MPNTLQGAAASRPFFVPDLIGAVMTTPSPSATGLAGRCPGCGEGKLFDSHLKIRPRCAAGGLDFAFADPMDGPAVLIMFIAGFAIVGGVLALEVAYEPPFWAHMAIWLPLTIALCLGLLRPMKALAVSLQYARDAGEGRLER